MKLALLPAIAVMIAASPTLAQTREHSGPLRTVQSATRTATIQPVAAGFVSGAQIYSYSEGTIFHAYAAPGWSPTSCSGRVKA